MPDARFCLLATLTGPSSEIMPLITVRFRATSERMHLSIDDRICVKCVFWTINGVRVFKENNIDVREIRVLRTRASTCIVRAVSSSLRLLHLQNLPITS